MEHNAEEPGHGVHVDNRQWFSRVIVVQQTRDTALLLPVTWRYREICEKFSKNCRKERKVVGIRERVAASARLPTPWIFEPVKGPDDIADYCLDCSFLSQWKHNVLVFTLTWSEAR